DVAGVAEAGGDGDRQPAVAGRAVVAGEEAEDRAVLGGGAPGNGGHDAAAAATDDDGAGPGERASDGRGERGGAAVAPAATDDGDLHASARRHRKAAMSSSARTTWRGSGSPSGTPRPRASIHA